MPPIYSKKWDQYFLYFSRIFLISFINFFFTKKKDIGSSNPYESGVAINGLSNVCSPDLARDLAPDLVALLSSSRPYVRKKAVLVLYKVFLQFPQALRPAFPRLKEKLEDADMGSFFPYFSLIFFQFFFNFGNFFKIKGVVSGAVNVICELARKNPKNYLTLAPILFKILTVSTNNWMLIKIIKLVLPFSFFFAYFPLLMRIHFSCFLVWFIDSFGEKIG